MFILPSTEREENNILDRLPDRIPLECNFCPAKVWLDGRYYCDPSQFTESGESVKVARLRLTSCKKNSSSSLGNSSVIISLLKSLLR